MFHVGLSATTNHKHKKQEPGSKERAVGGTPGLACKPAYSLCGCHTHLWLVELPVIVAEELQGGTQGSRRDNSAEKEEQKTGEGVGGGQGGRGDKTRKEGGDMVCGRG